MGCKISSNPEQEPLVGIKTTNNSAADYDHVEQWLAERGAEEDKLDTCEYKAKKMHEKIWKIFQKPADFVVFKEQVTKVTEIYKSYLCYESYDTTDSAVGNNGQFNEVKSMTFGDVLIPADFLSHNKAVNSGDLSRKYLLLNDKADTNGLLKLLTEAWNLPLPNLIISLISGAVSPEIKVKDQLNDFLAFLSRTKTWIFSDGMHKGSSFLLSKAVRIGLEANEKVHPSFDGVTLIGIAPWHNLDQRKLLYGMSLEGCYDSYYFYSKRDKLLKGEVDRMANPYQNAYLFESTYNRNEGFLKDKLVQFMRNKHPKCDQNSSNDDNMNEAPIRLTVSLVIGGSKIEEILPQIKRSVQNNLPVIVVCNTGYAPNLVFEIYKTLEEVKQRSILQEHDFTDEEEEALRKKLLEVKHTCILQALERNLEITEDIDEWKSVMEYRHYLSFLHLGENDMIRKFVTGTLKGKKHIQFMSASMLAGSFDFVKATLFREIDPNFDTELQHTSLCELERLYIESLSQDSQVGHILFDDMKTKPSEGNQLPIIGKHIFKMMGWQNLVFYQSQSGLHSQKSQFWHLFLYAILSNKSKEIIEFLASLTESPLGAALIAHGLFKALGARARKASDKLLGEDFRGKSYHFLELATNVLNTMFVADKKLAYNLLNKNLPFELGPNVTMLTFAIDSNAKMFLDSPCCQTYISDEVWHGSVRLQIWRRIVAVMVPVFGWLFLLDRPCRFCRINQSNDAKPECQNEQSELPVTFLRRLKNFYKAPATKYIFDLASYVAFLAVFTCFLLTDLMPVTSVSNLTASEWLTYCFVAGKIAEEVGQIVNTRHSGIQIAGLNEKVWSFKDKLLLRTRFFKLNLYFSEGAWNTLDCTVLMLFMVSTVYRFTVSFNYFQIVRIMFSLTILLTYTRILKYFYVFKQIGPRVIAITLMLAELAKMCLVLIVFILAFGVAFQVVVNPGQQASLETLVDLIYRPYWQMYGELFLEDASSGMGRDVSNSSCSFLKENGYPELHCFPAFPYILIAIYLIISNVLLLNLIIAIFGNTLLRVEEQAQMHWAYQQCVLTREYYYLSPVPPPLNIIWYIIVGVLNLVEYIKRRTKSGRNNSAENQVESDYFLQEPLPDTKQLEQQTFRNCLQTISG